MGVRPVANTVASIDQSFLQCFAAEYAPCIQHESSDKRNNVFQGDRSNNANLHTEDAAALLKFHRDSEKQYGTRAHAFLEFAWFTGARQGGFRALDIRDVHLGINRTPTSVTDRNPAHRCGTS